MKRCLKCDFLFLGDGWRCPQCSWSPEFIDGMPIFAKDISGANESYDPAWYKELVALEEKNFWFNARNELIQWFAKKYISENANYLELGCGSGFVLQMLHKTFPVWKISATEAQVDGLAFARSRVTSKVFLAQVDGTAIPFREEFDVIGAYDVIEHIKEDELVFKEIHGALKSNGLIFFSVPQHMFLWSQFDDVGCHIRRYEMPEIRKKLTNAGFEIVDSTSFNSLLLPLMLFSRYLKRSKDKQVDVMGELKLPLILNKVLSFVLKIELLFIKCGTRWPIGGSRFVIAKKN